MKKKPLYHVDAATHRTLAEYNKITDSHSSKARKLRRIFRLSGLGIRQLKKVVAL